MVRDIFKKANIYMTMHSLYYSDLYGFIALLFPTYISYNDNSTNIYKAHLAMVHRWER